MTILLNAVVVFVSAQPGLDPVAANIIQGFYRFSTVCFFVEYIARIWLADLCAAGAPRGALAARGRRARRLRRIAVRHPWRSWGTSSPASPRSA